MSRLFPFITVFALFAVLAASELSAAPPDFRGLRSAPSSALWESSPVLFSASADTELYLGQKRRRRGGGGRLWSNLYYGDTTLKPKNQDTVHPNFYGLQLGLDIPRGGGIYSRCFLGINQSKIKFAEATSTIDNFILGTGRLLYFELCYFAFTGSVGYDRYAISQDGTSKGDGLQTNFFGEFGFSFPLGQWAFKPFYALQYDFLYHGNIGNDPVVQRDWNGHGLTQLFGLRLNWTPIQRLELQSRAVWIHEMLDKPPPFYHMHFSPGHGVKTPAIMFYEGNVGRDWAWFGIGGKLDCALVHLFADYDIVFNGRQTTHLGSVGLLLGW